MWEFSATWQQCHLLYRRIQALEFYCYTRPIPKLNSPINDNGSTWRIFISLTFHYCFKQIGDPKIFSQLVFINSKNCSDSFPYLHYTYFNHYQQHTVLVKYKNNAKMFAKYVRQCVMSSKSKWLQIFYLLLFNIILVLFKNLTMDKVSV